MMKKIDKCNPWKCLNTFSVLHSACALACMFIVLWSKGSSISYLWYYKVTSTRHTDSTRHKHLSSRGFNVSTEVYMAYVTAVCPESCPFHNGISSLSCFKMEYLIPEWKLRLRFHCIEFEACTCISIMRCKFMSTTEKFYSEDILQTASSESEMLKVESRPVVLL